MQLTPYLAFPGTCAEAFDFYAELFGGEVGLRQFVRDSPMAADVPPDKQDYVLHSHVSIGAQVLMGSDNTLGGETAVSGVYLQVTIDDLDKARRIFGRLAKNGMIVHAFAATFWAAGFGICRDRYGVLWIISCEAPA